MGCGAFENNVVRRGPVIVAVLPLGLRGSIVDRISLGTQADKIVRFFERDVLCANEAAHKLIGDIEYDMAAFGIDG